jgi:hypothetical protein
MRFTITQLRKPIGTILRREPLVHFLALAAVLFVVERFWSETKKETIHLDQQVVSFLIKQREELVLRALTPDEHKQTIDEYIRDEILYREAYKRGLDKDSRMRRHLISKMRRLAIGNVKKPTEDQLRAYFATNRARFRRPATISFDHVYFKDPSSVPEGLLDQLRSGRDHKTLGGIMLGFARSAELSPTQIAGAIGPKAARTIIAIDDSQWHGPVPSIRGAHFVRIVTHTPERDVRFEDVQRFLQQDWNLSQARAAIDRQLEKLRGAYHIKVDAKGFKP